MSSNNLTLREIQNKLKKQQTSSHQLPQPVSVDVLLQQQRRRRASRPHLLPVNSKSSSNCTWLCLHTGIHEIAGAAGSGKTQVCIGVCFDWVGRSYENNKSQKNCVALYIAVGTSQVSKVAHRLQKMVESRGVDKAWLDRILTKAVVNTDDLKSLLAELPSLLEKNPIAVIVIDNISDLFRGTLSSESHVERSADLFAVASRLKALSEQFQVPVLVVNQVATVGTSTIPALGLSWAQCVNRSYFVEQKQAGRLLRLLRSSEFPPTSLAFRIESIGVLVEEEA